MNSFHSKVAVLLRVWTFPNTLLGLAFGYAGLIFFGGSAQKVDGCWEFHGGLIQWLLEKAPIGGGALAMTLGHSIWGRTKAALDITREHEHVHVRQYEKWGPFFIPAYFAASLIVWAKGGDPYRDNPFEVEAYSKSSYNNKP